MEDILVEFKNVTKRFDHRTILDKVNLKIYDGHVTTVIGKSGTGKSVLLKHIIGLLSPTEGTILFRGKSIDEMSGKEWEEVLRILDEMGYRWGDANENYVPYEPPYNDLLRLLAKSEGQEPMDEEL